MPSWATHGSISHFLGKLFDWSVTYAVLEQGELAEHRHLAQSKVNLNPCSVNCLSLLIGTVRCPWAYASEQPLIPIEFALLSSMTAIGYPPVGIGPVAMVAAVVHRVPKNPRFVLLPDFVSHRNPDEFSQIWQSIALPWRITPFSIRKNCVPAFLAREYQRQIVT